MCPALDRPPDRRTDQLLIPGAMQDMSCLISEPANSPPRILRSDVNHDKSISDTKEKRTRIMPKKNHHKEVAVLTSEKKTQEPCDKSLSCKICEKSFASSAALEKHCLTHTDEKAFRCKMCDLSFATNGGLLRHVRVHKKSSSNCSDSEDSDSSPRHAESETQRNSRKRRCENITNGDAGEDELAKKKSKTINNNVITDETKLKCTECDRDDFASLNVLETHIEESHPDYQIKCVSCELSFKNHRALNLHRYMVHAADQDDQKKIAANSVSGFKDCTFIDFSSQKFPEIAKTVCEQNVHKSVTEQQFRCPRCSRDFPCESALNIHAKNCINDEIHHENSTNSRRSPSGADDNLRRDDFFANLDLQNKSPNFSEQKRSSVETIKPKPAAELYPTHNDSRRYVDNTKDLADIQSILSVTSTGGLLEQLTQKARDNMVKEQDEEVQDAFASEFRKMKLRGEFPCRLCTAIFPNLRALKGHNRVHLNGNSAGPYRCNMCPHSSLDKAALVRHMRTHNGDRPYECAVCNYAFTTKANCERHLRNRHSKVTREDVKRSIIYHPSEDPNNDEVNNKLSILREDIKRTQVYADNDVDRTKNGRITPVSHYPREPVMSFQDRGMPISLPRDLSIVIPQPREILKNQCSMEPIVAPHTSEDLLQPRIKVKGFGQLTQIPEYMESDNERDNYSEEEIDPTEESFAEKAPNYSGEIPMDLSTGEPQEDVLDLSKKKNDKSEDKSNDSDNESYPGKSVEFNNNHAVAANILEKTQQMLLAKQLLKGVQVPKMDPATNFYQLSQLYNRGAADFPGLGIPPSFPLNPYFLSHNPFLPPTAQNIVEMNERLQKEIIRGLQLSGGGLVDPNIMNNFALAAKERFQAFHQQPMTPTDMKSHTPNAVVKIEDDNKPQQLHINTDTPTTIPYAQSISSPVMPSPKSQKKETISSQSPNSVKMVIKNGVLMPKQKQRRYRTERPFSCEHCSARFTLRSNMERHIKQQHPQYWTQRQRNSMGNLPRKSPMTLVPKNVTVPQNMPLSYDNRLNYMKGLQSVGSEASLGSQEDRKTNSPQSPSTPPLLAKSYNMISDQVKYAILAQQLKSHSVLSQTHDLKNRMKSVANGENEDEDEEDALIIDEESVDDKSLVAKQLIKSTESKEDSMLKAKKAAHEIFMNAVGQNDISKDFDWKIAGNLISKNPHSVNPSSDIPTFVSQIDTDKLKELQNNLKNCKSEEGDLVSVSKLLDNAASQDPFGKYFKNDYSRGSDNSQKENNMQTQCEGSEEDEEGLVASSGSASEGNNSGSDENRSESEVATQAPQKKKSAYSSAPNRVSCPYCYRKFPWSSSLRRHVLTHTGQKPYKCPHCPLLFTTKSNCDRHLLRKHGSSSQQTIQNTASSSMPAAESADAPCPEAGNQGFMVRNVPERPHKCSTCPSSTFSTRSNLRKHMSFKHDINIPESEPGSPGDKSKSRRESCDNDRSSSEGEKSPRPRDDFQRADWEHQILSSKCSPAHVQDVPSNTQNSDLPFKCHLCEGSYAERQAALDHIRDSHEAEYELLVCKGALEAGVNASEEMGSSISGHRSEGGDEQGSEENIEQLRGKFPDYANRKVVCAFCVRRFWSAEDLRRHMRTHTGERPFSCDVCSRRFTLKHSMLRHRKKHSMAENRSCEDLSIASGDEDMPSPVLSSTANSNVSMSPLPSSVHPDTSTPISSKMSLLNAYQISIHTKNLSTSPEVPSNVNNNNSPPAQSYESKLKMKRDTRPATINKNRYTNEDNEGQESEVESGGDLIGNLLGISDRGMINKLLSSAEEAAKLLGVNK